MARPVMMILARQWSELSDLPVLLVDASGRLVHGNESAASLLGGDALSGSPAWEVFAARVRPAGPGPALPAGEAVTGLEPFCQPARLRSREGVEVQAPLVYVPVVGIGGEHHGGMLVLGHPLGGPSPDDSYDGELP